MKDAAGVCAPPKSGLTFNRVQVGRHWPARRSPGGGRSRGPVVMGGEELARGRHSGGVPLLKTRGVAGIVSFARKWKFHLSLSFSVLWTVVTPVSFCCSQGRDCWSCLRQRNAYQLESLFVCFYSTFSCCKKQFRHHHDPNKSLRIPTVPKSEHQMPISCILYLWYAKSMKGMDVWQVWHWVLKAI